MRTGLFIFFLLITSVASAQKSLTSSSFQVSVRPVLNGILNDFYQMIVLFPDFPKTIVPVIEEVENLNEYKVSLLQDCPGLLSDKCLATLNKLNAELGNLEAKTLVVLAHQIPTSSLHLNTLAAQRLLMEFQATLTETKGVLSNTTLMIKAQVRHKHKTYPLIKKLDELANLASLALVEYIPHPYQDDFRHFYFNFINPIQVEITKNVNYEFVNRNITYLNFTINLLNMNLTKRNKKTPEGMSPYLSTMHNRWNSILRYYY